MYKFDILCQVTAKSDLTCHLVINSLDIMIFFIQRRVSFYHESLQYITVHKITENYYSIINYDTILRKII